MFIIELNDTVLEIVSGGGRFGGTTVKQTNFSLIKLTNFDAGANCGSSAGISIGVTQLNLN